MRTIVWCSRNMVKFCKLVKWNRIFNLLVSMKKSNTLFFTIWTFEQETLHRKWRHLCEFHARYRFFFNNKKISLNCYSSLSDFMWCLSYLFILKYFSFFEFTFQSNCCISDVCHSHLISFAFVLMYRVSMKTALCDIT